jgi:hypothetical protein
MQGRLAFNHYTHSNLQANNMQRTSHRHSVVQTLTLDKVRNSRSVCSSVIRVNDLTHLLWLEP